MRECSPRSTAGNTSRPTCGNNFGELLERSRQHIADLDVSADLEEEVARLLQEEPALAWNDAVAEITERQS